MNPPTPIPAPEGEEKALPIGKLWIKRDTVSMGEKYTPQERLRVYVKPHDGAHAYVPEAALSAEKQRGPRAAEEERIDAERWRALLKCERIRILGSAGIGTQAQHLGMEIWDSYPGKHPDASEVLTRFADTIRARAAKEPS